MEAYNLLARLLEYPREGFAHEAERCRQSLELAEPEAASYMANFRNRARGLTTEQLQELFTQTFDLNPLCVLEVGWQLFGEEYKRGEFLVKMRQELRRYGLPESCELPDHLTHVLKLLSSLEPQEADRFVEGFVLPALEKMLAGMRGKGILFEDILLAIRVVLTHHHTPAGQEVKHA